MAFTGSEVKVLEGGGVVTKAGGSAATVEITATEIDRLGFYSGVVAYHVDAILAVPATVELFAKVQDSDTSGGTFSDFSDGVSLSVAGVTGANRWVIEENVNLRDAERYLKVSGLATVPANATCSVSAVFILGEADVEPC